MSDNEDPWFADCPDRRGTWSEKWERWAGSDVVPAWIADMDFRSPSAVMDAMQERVAHGVFGYTVPGTIFAESVAAHLAKRHAWQINPQHVVPIPGMVVGLNIAARAIGEPDDEILVLTPIYPPFLMAPPEQNRRVVEVPLLDTVTGWQIDWDALERLTTARTRTLWLCSPHNPTGRVFTRSELERLASHCVRHDIMIVSDEAHADLIIDPAARHTPMAALNAEVAARTITLLAPSKTWNLPGLGCAVAVIADDSLRRRFKAARTGLVPHVNALGLTAAVAAYQHGGPWLERLCHYLHGNRELVAATMARLSHLRWHSPQATYLAWIDARTSGHADPAGRCEQFGLGVSDGKYFAGEGFFRLNFACPRSRLREALARMEQAFLC